MKNKGYLVSKAGNHGQIAKGCLGSCCSKKQLFLHNMYIKHKILTGKIVKVHKLDFL